MISKAGDELLHLTAPRNSSGSIRYGVQQLSGQYFPRKIEMVSKRGVVLKNRVSRSCKVCVSAEHSMDTQAGGKHKSLGQDTSYKFAQCTVLLCAASCFSLYHQYKDYENKNNDKNLRKEM